MGNFKRQTIANTTQRQIKRRTTRSIMNAQASAINQSNNKHSFELQPFDVLCGRNKTSYNNIGNRRFRILINLNLPHYLECQSRNERSGMILSLTRDLCCCSDESQNFDKLPSPNSCVRFFKSQKGVNELIELDFKGCREKIGHALRDAATQHNNSSNSSKSKEVIYETTRKQQQQQKEEEAIVALTNLNGSYIENNNGNNNITDNNGTHNDLITSSGAPRNSSRYSMEILHSLREEVVPNISSLLFNNAIDYNHQKDDSSNHQQESNSFTGDGINSVMRDIEPLAV